MAQIKPYHIIPEYSIALVGITTNDTATSSRPDPGTEFLDPATILQNTVDHINKHERVDRIIAMTHIGEIWLTSKTALIITPSLQDTMKT